MRPAVRSSTIAIAVICGGAGFIAAAYVARETGYFNQASVESQGALISHADCAVTSGRDVDQVTVALTCGLSRKGWEAIIARYLEGLDLDAMRRGREPTPEELAVLVRRLGTVEAVEALLGGLVAGESTGTSSFGLSPPTEVLFNASVPADPAAREAAPVWIAQTPEEPPAPELAPEPETQAGRKLVEGARAKCGVAALRDLRQSAIEIVCGATEEEVDALVSRLVEESGAASLQALLAQDAAKRDELIAGLATLSGLEADLTAALIAKLEASGGLDGDAADSEIELALQEQMRQAVVLLRMGGAAEMLFSRQAAAADALGAGDYAAAQQVFGETADELRTLTEDLAPEAVPVLVAAARGAEEARAALENGRAVAGIRGLNEAAALVVEDWPATARALAIEAADALGDSLWHNELITASGDPNFDPGLIAARRWLAAAEDLRSEAVDLGLSAAGVLNDRGEAALDDALLHEAGAVLDRLAPTIDPEDDPERHARLQGVRAGLKLAEYARSGKLPTLREGAAAADEAVRVAEELDPEWATDFLTTRGIARLELGRASGDRSHYESALEDFETVAAATEPEDDLLGWAKAENNVAVVQSGIAGLDDDDDMRAAAAETYRRVARRLRETGHREEWAFITRNLADALTVLGALRNAADPVREAIAALEEVLAYERERGQSLALTETLERLARAWHRVGLVEEDEAAFETAQGIMDEVVEIYGGWALPAYWIEAQQRRADLFWDAGAVMGRPEAIARASELYGEARAAAREAGLEFDYVALTLRQARAAHAAAAEGAAVEGSPPAELLAEAQGHLDGLAADALTPAWKELRDEVAALQDEVR